MSPSSLTLNEKIVLHVSDRDIECYLKTRRHHRRSERTLNIGRSSSVEIGLTLMRKQSHADRISVSLVPESEKTADTSCLSIA